MAQDALRACVQQFKNMTAIPQQPYVRRTTLTNEHSKVLAQIADLCGSNTKLKGVIFDELAGHAGYCRQTLTNRARQYRSAAAGTTMAGMLAQLGTAPQQQPPPLQPVAVRAQEPVVTVAARGAPQPKDQPPILLPMVTPRQPTAQVRGPPNVDPALEANVLHVRDAASSALPVYTGKVCEAAPAMHFEQLLQHEKSMDVKFVVGDQTIPAHGHILASACEVFKDVFKHSRKVKITGISAESFSVFIRYVYTDVFPEECMNPTLAKDFLAMDMFFNFPEMKLKVVNWLQANIKAENMLQVLNVAEKFVLTELVEAAYEMIAANPDKFINIQNLYGVAESTLQKVLSMPVFKDLHEEKFRLIHRWFQTAIHPNMKKVEQLKALVDLNQVRTTLIKQIALDAKLYNTEHLFTFVQERNRPLKKVKSEPIEEIYLSDSEDDEVFLNSSEEREREDETAFNETQSKVDEHGKEGSEHSSNKTVTLLLTPNKTLKALETPQSPVDSPMSPLPDTPMSPSGDEIEATFADSPESPPRDEREMSPSKIPEIPLPPPPMMPVDYSLLARMFGQRSWTPVIPSGVLGAPVTIPTEAQPPVCQFPPHLLGPQMSRPVQQPLFQPYPPVAFRPPSFPQETGDAQYGFEPPMKRQRRF